MEGIELSERTIIVQPKFRKVVKAMFISSSTNILIETVKSALKKLKPMVGKQYEEENAIFMLLEHISNLHEKMVPKCYVDLLYEIAKNTPVVGFIQSQSRIFLASVKSYLDKHVDIFEDKDLLDHVNGEVPVFVNFMKSIKEYEKKYFPSRSCYRFIECYHKVVLECEKACFRTFC